MKVILIVFVFLASFYYSETPAAACGEDWYTPCCPWWEPEKCPPPIKAKIRDGARAASRYYGEAFNFFSLAAIPICASTAAAFPMIVPCVGVGGGGAYAAIMKGIYDNIADAASRYAIGTPPYWEPYELWIPTAADLGIEYTGDANTDNMIYALTVSWGYMLFIVESSDRTRYCYYDEAANCAGWQQARVDEGLRVLGEWIRYGADDLDGMAYDITQTGVDLQGIPVVQVTNDEATWARWMANEVQR